MTKPKTETRTELQHNAITGTETVSQTGTPYHALVQFYAAFNNRDFSVMRDNWLQSGDASMSNPLGGIKHGWNEIKNVYKNIFTGAARVYVEFYDYTIHKTAGMFVAVGRERGTLIINNKTTELAIRTSRIFILQGTQWKQLHHHGSMDNPELLSHYQNTLLN